jgi:hypothetical protein
MENPLMDRGGVQVKKELTDNDQLTIKLLASYVCASIVLRFLVFL